MGDVNRLIAWFSSGAASAVMTKLLLSEHPEAIPVQCDMGDSEHPDNRRFTKDCEAWFGKPVLHLKSEKYSDVDDVIERRNYMSGPQGAPCTGELKTVPRLNFQLPSDTHFWGYTADANDLARWEKIQATYPLMKQRAPLIERGLTKQACLAMIEKAGIAPPIVYSLGFTNANCIGCVKAASPKYWALVREHFPEVFDRRVKQSRRIGARLTRLAGNGDERFFLDEIPDDQPTAGAMSPSCDFLCEIAQQDISELEQGAA